MVDILDIVKEKCTGCGGCSNACPVNAISLEPDKDGFLVPVTNGELCVDCNKCTGVCPALNLKKENEKKPVMYAARAADEIRAVSSSGGMFTPIANYVFDKGGVVAGVAFGKDFSVDHIMITSPGDIGKLRGSKYAQSHPHDIYRQVKSYLVKDKPVLFTGTPCQVAALYNYLGREYENLYTVDLICHGVQPQQILHKYLEQKFRGKKVTSVGFRDKQFGWTAQHIYITFDDGTDYHGTSSTDPYLKAFLKNLDLRKSCERCPFSVFPRHGDISIGDFWGIQRIDKTQSDGKGTSLIYINSRKGREILDGIKKDLVLKEFPLTTKFHNRVILKMTPNVNRQRFFKFMRDGNTTFESAVSKALSYKYHIGLVSNYYAGNFGGSLTQYALYNTLEDMGYNCLMIERPKDAPGKALPINVSKLYLEPPYPKIAMSHQKETADDMRSFNNSCEMFVVGSDQLYQYNLYKALGRMPSLEWVDNTKKKIAYAASFGHDHLWGDKRGLAEMAYFIRQFDAFSVREDTGVDIARENFGIDAQWVLDPVFLCDTGHYDTLISKAKMPVEKHYIASYILDPTEKKADILKYAEKNKKMKACVFSEFSRIGEYTAPLSDKGLNVVDPRVEERLKLIKNCDFFVTDSFHGTCFAIIMNKPFVSIMNKNRGADRFPSLLSMFGLEDRLVTDINDESWKEIIEKPIDFAPVNNILKREKAKCLKWLRQALEAEKTTVYNSYDVLINRIVNQENEIKELKKMVTALLKAQGGGLSLTSDPVMYFEQLAEKKEDYIIVATVKDTPGMSVSSEVDNAMKKAGFKMSIRDKHQYSYICILNGGETVYEELSRGELVKRGLDIDGFKITCASRNMKVGNVSKNIINGKEYSVNRRGLNITVIDKKDRIVLDTVNFDMHLSEYKCNRSN